MEITIQQIIERLKDMKWNLEIDPQKAARISEAIQCATKEPRYSKFLKEMIATPHSDPEYDGPYIEIGKGVKR